MNIQYRVSKRIFRRSRRPFPARTGSQTPASGFSRNKLRLVLSCAVFVVCLFAFSVLFSPLGFSQDKKQKPKPTETTQKKETKQKTKPSPPPVEKLITKDPLTKLWQLYSAENGGAEKKTWQVVPVNGELILKCTGKPNGYIRTKKTLENYILELEFRYPGTDKCNSGILLHVAGQDKIWPGSIQIQLHYPKLGRIFPITPAKTEGKNEVNAVFPNPPLNKWIKLKIESKDGAVTLHIDGKKHGTITGCTPKRGFIALQSEGFEIHFKNITIKELPAAKPKKKKVKKG